MKMEKLPEKGETVTGAEFFQVFGGKGANQAVAASRAGARTLFFNAVGNDPYADRMVESFRADKLDLSCLDQVEDLPSGHALIMVGTDGMNYISVAPGANARMTPDWVTARAQQIQSVPFWILQCEIPEDTIRTLLEEIKTPANQVLWNFAPAIAFPNPPLHACDVLVVNEVEAEQLSGIPVVDQASAEKAGQQLKALGAQTIIITLGVDGSLILEEGSPWKVQAFPVDAVDTTAAGDCYCGALAAALVAGQSMPEAVQFASAAAALSVQKLGAQPSLPRKQDILDFLG